MEDKKVKIAVKRPNEDKIEIVEISSVGGWSEMAKIVGGGERVTLDRVHFSESPYELTMYVDDNGLMKELPLNFYLESNNIFYPVQSIVGTACFARGKIVDDDIVYEDLTDKDIAFIILIIERGRCINGISLMPKGED